MTAENQQSKTCTVYVAVTRTGTAVARFIRIFSRMPYSHASISGDASLNCLYSFCRTHKRLPLPATFNSESVGTGVFGKYDRIPCEIYAIQLTPEQYEHYCALIAHFKEYRRQYSYSLSGLLFVKFQKMRELQRKFVCSQFVAYVLKECGVELEKPACLYSPDDLRRLPCAKLVYRGELNRYCRDAGDSEPLHISLMQSAF